MSVMKVSKMLVPDLSRYRRRGNTTVDSEEKNTVPEG